MNDVAALEFTRQHAQPIPAERREELLATPGFGDVFSDHMVTVRWSAEVGWHDAQVGPLAAMSLHPATMALHYGQTIFEGMKAFWRPNGQRALFRPADHARRFNSSARRMAMPTLPEEDFVAALEALVRVDGAWVPRARGHSLYLRPFMIAAEAGLGNRPAEEYLFAVIGTPARPASSAEPKPLRLWAATRVHPCGAGRYRCGQVWRQLWRLLRRPATGRGQRLRRRRVAGRPRAQIHRGSGRLQPVLRGVDHRRPPPPHAAVEWNPVGGRHPRLDPAVGAMARLPGLGGAAHARRVGAKLP